jgi:uncharacterized protein (TIGR03083 family)
MRAELLRVLATLSDAQWALPTACPGWSVRDVAAHILADDLNILSNRRDHDGVYFEVASWEELVEKINAHNEVWVKAAQRISRRLLLTCLEQTGPELAALFAQMEAESATSKIEWAGQAEAPMWLEVGRELTEYWMHHQHVCEAVGVTSLKERDFMLPVLTIFVHALPRTYQSIAAPANSVLRLTITGPAASDFYLIRGESTWVLSAGTDWPSTRHVTLDDQTAWRVFTKGIDPQQAMHHAHITGDLALGQAFFQTVAIIA